MKKWSQSGNQFSMTDVTTHIEKVPNGVYTLNQSMFGFYLSRIEDEFEFSHKLYGLEESLIGRVKRTWDNTDKNLGVLLNGLKGTGKTVTAKVIANQANVPVIIINFNPEGGGIPEFLNQITQDVVIFIDEYEKIFGEESDLLTIMDGVFNTEHRKLFLLTTNKTYLNDNLLQRPSRIRYFKTFNDLTPDVIAEIVDDNLDYPEFREELIKIISNLEIITIDIVKAVIEETNIHRESPNEFISVFNVKKISGRHTVYQQVTNENDQVIETLYKQSVKISPRQFSMESIGTGFSIDHNYIGEITDVIDFDTIQVTAVEEVEVAPTGKGKKITYKEVNKVYTFRIEAYDQIHRNYSFTQFPAGLAF